MNKIKVIIIDTKIILYIFLINTISIFYSYQGIAKICITEFTDTNNLSYKTEFTSGEVLNAWIVTNNSAAYYCFNEKSNQKKRLMMGYRFKILKDNFKVRFQGKYWSLLIQDGTQVEKKNIIGWVSHDNLIFNEKPLRDYKTGMLKKALIKEGNCNNGNALRVYSDCKLINSIDSIEVGAVFYVYDSYFNDEIKSVLIGVTSQLNSSSLKDPLLLGWVDSKFVTFWNTRIACEFPVDSIVEMMDENNNVVFKTKSITPQLSYNSMRNPILSVKNEYFKVGVFSGLSAEQLHLKNNTLPGIQTGLEVLFVIDGSESMTHAFNAILGYIERTAIFFEEEKGLKSPRFSLLIYRNPNINNQLDYCKHELTLYPMGSIHKLIDNLQNRVRCINENIDIEVPMYKGIIEGIKKCQFDTGKNGNPRRLRTVIHLGDARDKGIEGYDPKNVSDILSEYHIYKYISINVSGSDLSGFVYSYNQIPFKNKTLFNAFPPPLTLLNSIFQNLVNETKSVNDQIKIISRGFSLSNELHSNEYFSVYSKGLSGISKNFFGNVSENILQFSKKRILANNIQIEKYSTYKQYIEANIPKTIPLKIYLFVSLVEIEKIICFLTNILDSNYEKKYWNNYLKIIIGDNNYIQDNIELSLEENNNKNNGIPITAGFMKYTKKQFLNLKGPKLQKALCEAEIVKEQFKALINNKYISNIHVDSFIPCNYKITYSADINEDGKISHLDQYFFHSHQDVEKMAWIPLEHFSFQQ